MIKMSAQTFSATNWKKPEINMRPSDLYNNLHTASGAVDQRCSVKKVFLEISPNSHENTCAGDSFLGQTKLCHHPPPPITTHHQSKYIHFYPPPSTARNDISTNSYHPPPIAKAFFIRNPFLRISSHCMAAT